MSWTGEQLLAKFNEIRKEVPKDPDDVEWACFHHAFLFISYHMKDFCKYLEEAQKKE